MSFFLNNWYLFLLAIGSAAMLIAPTLTRGGASGITPAQAVRKINSEKAVVIDVRGAEDFAAAHIKGARNIALEAVEKQLPASVKNKKNPVLFVCATGARAIKAMAVAKRLGYEQSHVISGGMKAWKEAGLPVAAGKKTS